MKTMKKILAVLTFVICVMFCCISLGKQGVLAAGNYKDTSYSFSFQNRALYTQARSKNDYTSSYMKCTSCTSNTSYTAHVVATTSIFPMIMWTHPVGMYTVLQQVQHIKC